MFKSVYILPYIVGDIIVYLIEVTGFLGDTRINREREGWAVSD